jgi:hypothetical protein
MKIMRATALPIDAIAEIKEQREDRDEDRRGDHPEVPVGAGLIPQN